MNLTAFVPGILSGVEEVIPSKPVSLEADYDVRVLFAIKSGNRAWSVPSPNSDYDVRFAYAKQFDWYLSIEPGRDVVELLIERDWDIRRALGPMIKPNPVMLELLSSPIRYRWSEAVCQRLVRFAGKTTFGEVCLHYYRNLAEKQWGKHVGHSEDVSLKKYFYILRPALAISWIKQNPSVKPPMHLKSLVEGQSLRAKLIGHIEELRSSNAQRKKLAKVRGFR